MPRRCPKAIKGAMLSCILSDTLEFRSPTTTPQDRRLAENLAADLGVDIPDYAAEMFAAKSDVSRLLGRRTAAHGFQGIRRSTARSCGFRCWKPPRRRSMLDRKACLMAAMAGVAAEDGADQVLLFVVDILNEEATLLVPNELVRTIAEKSFGVHRHRRHRRAARGDEPQEADHPEPQALSDRVSRRLGRTFRAATVTLGGKTPRHTARIEGPP